MSIKNYKDPIISQWNISNGEKYSKKIYNEQHTVTEGMFALIGLPDIQHKVIIKGYFEIGYFDEIKTSNQFKVDYENGYVFMHKDKEGDYINVTEYASRGVNYYPASRIWTKLNNLGEVSQTLDDIIERVEEVPKRVKDIEGAINSVNKVKEELRLILSNSSLTIEEVNRAIELSNLNLKQIDESIRNINNIKDELGSNLDEMKQVRDELSVEIKRADEFTSGLDDNLNLSLELKEHLDEIVNRGNSISENISNTLAIGEKLMLSMSDVIGNANNIEIELNNSILTAQELLELLKNTISDANSSNSILQDSISEAQQIEDRISNTKTGSIKRAVDVDVQVEKTINSAKAINTTLTNKISGAELANANLNNKLVEVNSIKDELSVKIDDGKALRDELSGIIAGTDYDQILSSINKLKQDKHNHTNKSVLDKISEDDGVLKFNGKNIGSGNMDMSVYDKDNNGKVDISEDSESLGGILADAYATKEYVDNHTKSKVDTSEKGIPNGIAELDNLGKIVSSQLPSYVDDVLEFDNLELFPVIGETGKIYVATDTNLTYRWSGTGYVEISPSIALGETSSTAYRGDRGKLAYNHSQAEGNPHNTSKADIGLGNVDNTSDIDKPISNAVRAALSNKVDNSRVLTNVPKDAKFTDTTYDIVTPSDNGLMSSQDKIKLNGIEEGADKTTKSKIINALGYTPVKSVNGKTGENITIDVPKIDIVNNLMDGGANKALSAEQGKVLFQSGIERNSELVANLNSKNVQATTNDSLKVNIEKVKNIETDKTGDATASASDILLGKTAYAKGNKLVGTLNLVGDATSDDVIKGKRFYNKDPKTIMTGNLELTGNATTSNVLSGKTFYTTNPKNKLTGSMINRGNVSSRITTQGGSYTIPSGYHSGSGKVTASFSNLTSSNIRKGVSIGGISGSFEGGWKVGKGTLDGEDTRGNVSQTFRGYQDDRGGLGYKLNVSDITSYSSIHALIIPDIALFNVSMRERGRGSSYWINEKHSTRSSTIFEAPYIDVELNNVVPFSGGVNIFFMWEIRRDNGRITGELRLSNDSRAPILVFYS